MKRLGLIGLAVASPLLLSACLSGATDPATDVTATSATLNGHGNADGTPRTWRFEYGTTTSYGSTKQGGTVELDVTPIVTGDGTWNLLLDATSTDGVEFRSREYGTASKRPELVLTVG
jgi:hypothetical protein